MTTPDFAEGLAAFAEKRPPPDPGDPDRARRRGASDGHRALDPMFAGNKRSSAAIRADTGRAGGRATGEGDAVQRGSLGITCASVWHPEIVNLVDQPARTQRSCVSKSGTRTSRSSRTSSPPRRKRRREASATRRASGSGRSARQSPPASSASPAWLRR